MLDGSTISILDLISSLKPRLNMFNENSPYYYFLMSDNFGRVIVLLLFAVSILSWFLMLEKWTEVNTALRKADKLKTQLQANSSCLILCNKDEEEDHPLSHIYHAGNLQLQSLLQTDPYELMEFASKNLLPRQISTIETESVRKSMEQSVNDEILRYEAKMSSLSTIVSVSPFCGLLGTVYGVMTSFGGMAEHGSANIAAIAPGIAGALLTTVAGLLVAIPSVVGYNLLSAKIKTLIAYMDNFTEYYVGNLTLHRVKK